MDGFKARLKEQLNHSLQFKLSFYLALTIILVALFAGAVSFASAFREAHGLQDGMLRQIAALAAYASDRQAASVALGSSRSEADEEIRVTVQWLPKVGARVAAQRSASDLPVSADIRDGMHTLTVDGEDFRAMVQTLPNGSRVVVSQETGMRNEIARESALRTVAPLLLLAPLLVLIVSALVRNLLVPIARLSAEVNDRPELALHPVEVTEVPDEVRPFLDAINGLLAKVKQSVDAQRRFLADAAHELRSPLAALSLQSERLSAAEMSDQARARLHSMRRGIERGRHLLEQLLTLARAQAAPQVQTTKVSLLTLISRVIEDALPLAESKGIDLGMSGSDEAILSVDETALFVAVKNIVDNAVRYSPPDSRVDIGVRVSQDSICVSVIDQGPGIAEMDRSRVFDPFYRVLGTDECGSGLGLAIVKEMADRLGASVSLAYTNADTCHGLTVRLCMPTPSSQTW